MSKLFGGNRINRRLCMYILFDYNFFSLLPPVDASYIFPANFGSDEKFILKQIKADQLCDAREIKKKKADSRYCQYSAPVRSKRL